MISKATLVTIYVLFTVLQSSCSGYIPITGNDSPISTNTAEKYMDPTPAQSGESSLEATQTLPSAMPAETLACHSPTASVSADNAYLRDGPDIRFTGSARYQKGEELKILGRYRDWLRVEAPNGNEGWLYKEWLTLPSDIEMGSLCSVSAEELPPTPQPPQKPEKTPESGEECIPTYYVSCP